MAEAPTSPNSDKHVSCELDIDTQSGVVTAEISPSDQASEVSSASILAQLTDQNVANWLINESAIEDVVHKFKKGMATRIIIAQRKDATFELKLTDDKMSAELSVTPAKGGSPLTVEAIQSSLDMHKVVQQRVRTQAIAQAVNATEPMTVVVAQGKAPVTGRDSTFSPLVQAPEENEAPEADENGKVDFYAGKTYLTVEPGTPLMERIPPQAGKVGMDIYGQIIVAESGKEIPFANDLTGTEFASNDPNLLIAKITGHPVYMPDGVRVDDTLELKDVNVGIGHVKFDGSVHIKGDVMAEMKVEVTGDVFVKGAVERAYIKAGNDIIVGSGVLGDTSQVVEEDEPLPEFECVLKAGGYVKARYINLADVDAQNSIEIREYAFNSLLNAGSHIYLGQDGGKGNLVGGEAHAGHAIVARTLGNKAYNKTSARVGISRDELQKFQKLKFVREQRISQARGLRKILEELKHQGETEELGQVQIEKAKKVHDTLYKLQGDLKDIDARISRFEIAKFREDEPNITATTDCFPNCAITINGALLHTKQEHKAISFIKRGRKITAKT